MKSLQLFFLTLLWVLFIGCGPDLCKDIDCGPGDCIEGICDCPDGFSGDNCEIEFCFGVDCINGDCDPQTETCNCYPDYYGEGCNILCVNGEFTNGDCQCFQGYEGAKCKTESRCRFMGWWNCSQWTISSQADGSTTPGFLPGSVKFESGQNIYEVELFPTENSNGLMLLSSDNIVVGKVTENTINFELQYLINGSTVHGTASLGENRVLNIELALSNPMTSLTETAKGTFLLARNIKE